MLRMNDVFKALADPTRREVLRLLRASGEMTAGELAQRFDTTRPTMSHHFSVLRQADLIGSRREGQQVVYFINTTVVEDVLSMIWGLFATGNGTQQQPPATPDAGNGQDRGGNGS